MRSRRRGSLEPTRAAVNADSRAGTAVATVIASDAPLDAGSAGPGPDRRGRIAARPGPAEGIVIGVPRDVPAGHPGSCRRTAGGRSRQLVPHAPARHGEQRRTRKDSTPARCPTAVRGSVSHERACRRTTAPLPVRTRADSRATDSLRPVTAPTGRVPFPRGPRLSTAARHTTRWAWDHGCRHREPIAVATARAPAAGCGGNRPARAGG